LKSQLYPALWPIAVSLATSLAGQTVIKLGMNRPEAAGAAGRGPLALVIFILRSPEVLLGLGLYGIGALAWIAVLARLDLSLAYPFLALNFVLIVLAGRVLLGEAVPPLRWLGVAVIFAGVVLVARSV
jgi:drug/metabolite transporter (DMT)-like permease